MGFAQTPAVEDASIVQARQLLQHGQYAEAEIALRETLARNSGSAEAHFLLGYALFGEHRPKDSLQEYTTASRLGAPSSEDLRCVALDYVLLQDFGDADHWLTQALTEDAKNAEAWYDLGRVRYTEARYEDARDAFEKALELEPRSVKAENNLGLAYEELHQPDAAAAAFRLAIAWQETATHPSEQPLLNLAALLMDRNDVDAAQPLLEQAAVLAPGNAEVHKQLGILYSRRNETEKAKTQFEQAVAATPDDASLHFLLGQSCRRTGDEAEARRELARAAALLHGASAAK